MHPLLTEILHKEFLFYIFYYSSVKIQEGDNVLLSDYKNKTLLLKKN